MIGRERNHTGECLGEESKCSYLCEIEKGRIVHDGIEEELGFAVANCQCLQSRKTTGGSGWIARVTDDIISLQSVKSQQLGLWGVNLINEIFRRRAISVPRWQGKNPSQLVYQDV